MSAIPETVALLVDALRAAEKKHAAARATRERHAEQLERDRAAEAEAAAEVQAAALAAAIEGRPAPKPPGTLREIRDRLAVAEGVAAGLAKLETEAAGDVSNRASEAIRKLIATRLDAGLEQAVAEAEAVARSVRKLVDLVGRDFAGHFAAQLCVAAPANREVVSELIADAAAICETPVSWLRPCAENEHREKLQSPALRHADALVRRVAAGEVI